MKPASWLIVLAGATAIAWVQLSGVPEAARMWTVILLVPLPAIMIVQGRKLAELESLPRTEAYISSIASLGILGLATLLVARVSDYSLSQLGLLPLGAWRTAVWTAAMTLAGVAVLFAFRFAGVREPRVIRDLMPISTYDRVLFTGVSLTAGVCEEIVFRGFLIHVLYSTTGSLAVALLLSSGAFGVAHAYQQPAGALRAALLGFILAMPLVIDGSIVPSILAHATIDILSGLWLSRYLLR